MTRMRRKALARWLCRYVAMGLIVALAAASLVVLVVYVVSDSVDAAVDQMIEEQQRKDAERYGR